MLFSKNQGSPEAHNPLWIQLGVHLQLYLQLENDLPNLHDIQNGKVGIVYFGL